MEEKPETFERIENADTAWRALIEIANGNLTTNDPWIAAAVTSVAAELRAARLGERA